jgi:hypothetical protein
MTARIAGSRRARFQEFIQINIDLDEFLSGTLVSAHTIL